MFGFPVIQLHALYVSFTWKYKAKREYNTLGRTPPQVCWRKCQYWNCTTLPYLLSCIWVLNFLFCITTRQIKKCHIKGENSGTHSRISRKGRNAPGIEWQEWWLVGVTLPFGWKNSPYVYQTAGLGPTSFFQEFRGSVFSLYRRSLKRGAVFFGRFLVAPIITENSCI